MKKNLKMLLAMLLALVMIVSVFAGCKKTEKAKPDDKVMVIAVEANFEEKWNPFMAESAYDMQVMEQIFVAPMKGVEGNALENWGGSITAGEVQADGSMTYTVTANKGMKFTDGEPITIDDYIYALYVTADPSYTGPAQLVAEDIKGVKEYYYDDSNYTANNAAAEAEAEKYTLANISEEDYVAYLVATNLEGWWDGDPAGLVAEDYTWSNYIEDEGFGDKLAEIDATNPDEMLALLALIEYTNYGDSYDPYSYYSEKVYKDIKDADPSSTPVDEIAGIVRVDDYTCTVTYNSVNIYGDRSINQYFMPEHYYGEIVKGSVGDILANVEPLGSGPYIWGGYDAGIVTVTANQDYFEGVPKTGTIRWLYVPPTDALTALMNGDVDIAVIGGEPEYVEEMDAAQDIIRYDLTDNAGYGYVGLNCENLKLGVRKGLFSLMNREPSVTAYYETLATVIERPSTTVIAEYPQDAGTYYEYSPEKALEYFESAGYKQVDGKLVDASGNQLVVNAYVGGSGIGDHPSFTMLMQAAEDMKNLGGEMQVQDVDFNVLQAAMNDGTADMFCLAWGDVNTCDKQSQFHSEGGQNRYRISDPTMDTLLEQILQTVDLEERSALYAEMLDLAMELAIEIPVYQRCNIIAYNRSAINLDTVMQATTFYDYADELWTVQMN
ncbi:MAG: ABC transporter substrate-binding protein [Oscillospiraceae bacterium]|jgi:peptide/nickel transport system substrate-binding protein|nr:ABC transporter substrate-binding protein [Oscillospiraceae bacterium]